MSEASRVLLISGSLRERSTNGAVVGTAAGLQVAGLETSVYNGMASLPHFNPDEDFDPLPLQVVELRDELAGADAVMLCTPEYAGALPGSFKNLLDWTIGGAALYEKPVGWINCAQPGRGVHAIDSLRKVLAYAGAEIVESACIALAVAPASVGEDGLIGEPSVVEALELALLALVETKPPAS